MGLLDMPPELFERIMTSLIRSIPIEKCCMRVIINKGGPSLVATTASGSPMCMAIRTNCGATVETVINAGAGINFRVRSKPNHDMHTPLEFAIFSKNFNVVKALIRAGADLPPLSTWPLYCTTYQTLRKVKFDREGIEVPKFKQFKVLSEADRALL